MDVPEGELVPADPLMAALARIEALLDMLVDLTMDAGLTCDCGDDDIEESPRLDG